MANAFDIYRQENQAAPTPSPVPVDPNPPTVSAFMRYKQEQDALPKPPTYEPPSTGQTVARPAVNGLANLFGFPGAISHMVMTGLNTLGEGLAGQDILKPEDPKDLGPMAAARDAILPKSVVLTNHVAEDLKGAARGAGMIPADPNYQPPKGWPRIADTSAEYISSTIPMALATDGASLLPAVATAGVSGAGAGVVRNEMEGSKYEPLAELATGLLAPAGINALRNLKNGAGIGPTMLKGGQDPITGEAQAGIVPFGVNTNTKETLGAFMKALLSGRGVQGSREAAGDAVATQQAAQKLKEGAARGEGGIPAAISELDAPNPLATDGYLPTAGTASNNMGIQALEAGKSSAPEFAARRSQNAQAISQGASKAMAPTLAPGHGQPGDTQTFLKAQGDAKISGAQTQLTDAEKKAQAAQAALETQKAGATAAANTTNTTAASERVANEIKDAKKQSSAINEGLYSQVAPETPVTYTNTLAALAAARKGIFSPRTPHPLIDSLQAERSAAPKAIFASDGTPITIGKGASLPEGESLTPAHPFEKMQNDLVHVNDELGNVALSDSHRRQLNLVKAGLLQDMKAAEPSNEALMKANARYAQEHAPLYKEEPAAGIITGKTDPGLAMDKFFATPAGAKQLGALAKAGSVSEANVRDYVISRLAGKNPTRANVAAFINQNGNQLKYFPKIQAELEATRGSLARGEDTLTQMLSDVKTKQAGLKDVQAGVAGSDAGKLAAADSAHGEISKSLFEPGAHKYMQRLIDAAKGDKTGAAMEGLKNAVKEATLDKITRTGRTLKENNSLDTISSDQLPISLDKILSMGLKGSDTRKALELLHTPEEMKNFDRITAQINAEARGRVGRIGESNTKEKTDAASLVNSVPSGVGGNVVKMLKFVVGNPAGAIAKDVNPKTAQVLLKALLDPEKAKALLSRPSAQNIAKVKALFAPMATAAIESNAQAEHQAQ